MRITRKEILQSVRTKRKHKRTTFYSCLAVLFLVAVIMITNWQLQNIWIKFVYEPQQQIALNVDQIRKNQKQAQQTVDHDTKAKPNHALNEHMGLSDITNSKKYRQNMSKYIIGAVYLPTAGKVSLPVILGNSDHKIQKEGLAVGAVTPISSMRIGKSSPFAIGGHNMDVNSPVLFSLLTNMQYGDKFYITNTESIFSYKVFKKYEVMPNQVSIFNPRKYKGKKIALLYTCNVDGSRREIIEGYQIKKSDFNSAPKKLQKKFNFSSKKKENQV